MLLSMTGHGDASGQNERLVVTAEIRSVNNRHLKLSVRCPDAFLAFEALVERIVRQHVTRGTVSVSLHVRRLDGHEVHRLDVAALQGYWRQLEQVSRQFGTALPHDLAPLLALPGIVEDGEQKTVEESDWPLFEGVIVKALGKLQEFRKLEGGAMAQELDGLCGTVGNDVDAIATRAPQVVAEYRDRLRDRINDLLGGSEIQIHDGDLLREISVFADRCDITEELMRLRSHLDQFRALLKVRESTGRKLEFLCQEMFREINTVGSKANDVTVAHHVVDVKAAIEKMREIVQNVE